MVGIIDISMTTMTTTSVSNIVPEVTEASNATNAVHAVKAYLLDLQRRIVAALEALDGNVFVRDEWQREQGGGGLTCLIEQGNVFARGGVNFSHVMGSALPPSASASRPELAGRSFEAMGVSLVLHPHNPYVPTVHMNVRFFVAHGVAHSADQQSNAVWWFGGGMDLTPYYGFVEDAQHFHRTCQQAVGEHRYADYKAWCDRYFYLKHRQEARGIGGIFFDDVNADGFDDSFGLIQSVGDHFLPAYVPIVERRQSQIYGQRELDFQAYRRGRYVEFNLVFDRGTLFGLQSGGRTESILMSMPPMAQWRYDWQPEAGSPEAALYTDFLPHRDWLGVSHSV